MTDFTKAGSQIDEWAVIAAATIRAGAATAIPDDLRIAIEIAIAKVEAVAHDGEATVIVEVSGNTTGDEEGYTDKSDAVVVDSSSGVVGCGCWYRWLLRGTDQSQSNYRDYRSANCVVAWFS